MILIADSGSTKTAWALCDGAHTVSLRETAGINPFYQQEEEMAAAIAAVATDCSMVQAIFFYGAGCTSAKRPLLQRVLQRAWPNARIAIDSDLLGAARALLQHHRGIACILGTGSNSCLYDGEKIIQNVSPLGFILGDEGSGAVLGRKFIGDCLKNQIPASLRQQFDAQFALSAADVIERVYRGAFPNRFLAQFAPFLAANYETSDYVRDLVEGSFRDFFQRNVLQYAEARALPIGFVGSVAYHFAPCLREIAAAFQLHIDTIEKSPIARLAQFHEQA